MFSMEGRAELNSAEALCARSKPAVAASLRAAEKFNQLIRKGRAELERGIITEERREKVAQTFERAKLATVNYLYLRSLVDASPAWSEMIGHVNRSELVVRLSDTPNGPTTYGAHVLRNEDGSGPDLVVVAGAALLADETPESLFFLLLHELGHTIDLSRYPVPVSILLSTSSPFASVVSCLRSQQSVGARVGDAQCHRRTSDKYQKEGKMDLADRFARSALELEKNPDFTQSGISAPCAGPQGSEAFADWLATEVAASLTDADMNKMAGFFCANYLLEKERDDLLKQTSSGQSMLDAIKFASTHPEAHLRIERIYFAHPRFQPKIWPVLMMNFWPSPYCGLGQN